MNYSTHLTGQNTVTVESWVVVVCSTWCNLLPAQGVLYDLRTNFIYIPKCHSHLVLTVEVVCFLWVIRIFIYFFLNYTVQFVFIMLNSVSLFVEDSINCWWEGTEAAVDGLGGCNEIKWMSLYCPVLWCTLQGGTFSALSLFNSFTILNQQNAQTCSLCIYVIISHLIFPRVSVRKGLSSGNQTK
jgi:hypothetical protein